MKFNHAERISAITSLCNDMVITCIETAGLNCAKLSKMNDIVSGSFNYNVNHDLQELFTLKESYKIQKYFLFY